MKAGSLRHYLTLETNTPTIDASGDTVDSWATEIYIYGRVTPVAGAETVLGVQPEARVTHEVETRYHPEITERKRFLFDSRYLYIMGIKNKDERNIEMLIQCGERA
jgi:SPP1 family predicted phage head-tail adaptor